jgi:hypothetical protein
MQPTKPITDRTFRYVPAARTDIRVRFNKIRWEQEQERRQREAATTQPLKVVK